MNQANELNQDAVVIKKAGRKKLNPELLIKIPEDWSLLGKFRSILEEANDKELGGEITSIHLLEWAIENMKKEHIEELREKSLSLDDRITSLWMKYKATNGVKISREEFIYNGLMTKKSKKDLN